MKYILILFLVLIGFINCKNEIPSEQKSEIEEIAFDRKNTPFDKCTKIEILNYPFNIKQGDSTFYNYPSTDSLSNYYPDTVDKKVVLDSTQTEELFSILYQNIVEMTNPADCYWPHHSILFYKNNEVVFYFHVCLSCHADKHSRDIPFVRFDDDKWCALRFFFEKLGLETTYSMEDMYACGRTPSED